MLRPELVRSYKTPLSSDVFTGWSIVRRFCSCPFLCVGLSGQWLSWCAACVQHDEEREESEKEVIAATWIMVNERVPALAAELNTLDTSSFREIYSRNGACYSSHTTPHKHTRVLF